MPAMTRLLYVLFSRVVIVGGAVRAPLQLLALFFVVFFWPSDFVFLGGGPSIVAALDFAMFPSMMGIRIALFYIIVAIAMLLLAAICIVWIVGSNRISGTAAGLAIFCLLFLHLPVTRGCVQIVTCHRSVQCYFDCHNGAAHWIAVGVACAAFLVVGVGTPVVMFLIARQLVTEFELSQADSYH